CLNGEREADLGRRRACTVQRGTDMSSMQISTASGAGSVPPRASLNHQLPRILIMGGAVGGFAIVAAEYGREYAHLGLRQGLALAGCFGLMLGGAAWEIR